MARRRAVRVPCRRVRATGRRTRRVAVHAATTWSSQEVGVWATISSTSGAPSAPASSTNPNSRSASSRALFVACSRRARSSLLSEVRSMSSSRPSTACNGVVSSWPSSARNASLASLAMRAARSDRSRSAVRSVTRDSSSWLASHRSRRPRSAICSASSLARRSRSTRASSRRTRGSSDIGER